MLEFCSPESPIWKSSCGTPGKAQGFQESRDDVDPLGADPGTVTFPKQGEREARVPNSLGWVNPQRWSTSRISNPALNHKLNKKTAPWPLWFTGEEGKLQAHRLSREVSWWSPPRCWFPGCRRGSGWKKKRGAMRSSCLCQHQDAAALTHWK